jgi:methionyl-tRNA synthetase
MDAFALHEGAASAFRLIDATNEFIAATAPWTLAKDPAHADRLTRVLFDAAEAIRLAAVLLEPIMPTSCREILRRVGTTAEGLTFDRDGRWRNDGERVLAQDGPLWPRLGAKETTTVTDNESTAAGAPGTAAPGAVAPASTAPGTTAPGTVAPGTLAPAGADRISIDDFMKVSPRC